MTKTVLRLIVLTISATLAPQVFAQVQTDVPPVVLNAKPVTVERIKIHGTTLEGNPERTLLIAIYSFFFRQGTPKRNVHDTRSSTRYTVTRSVLNNGPKEIHVPQTIEGDR